jgi:uncharacterized protein YggE
MKKIIHLACALVFFSSCADHISFGGINTEAAKTSRTISVTGSAEMEVPPDDIELVIQLAEYNREKNDNIEHIQKELFEKTDAAGIPRSSVTIKDVGDHYSYWRYYWDWYYWNNPANRPYITKQYSIRLESMLQVDKLVESLQMRGISNVYLGETQCKNLAEYRRQVKLEAIKMAKEKAEYMLNAIGEKTGSVISIKEVDGDSARTTSRYWGGRFGWPYYWDYPYYYGNGYYGGMTNQNMNGMASNSSINAPNSSVNGGGTNGGQQQEPGIKKIRLRYEVEAVFEIAQQ